MEMVLKICRFDPEEDSVPYFQEFVLTLEGTQTVLDALLLAWQQDSSLSFRRSCRSAICGSCAVRINGQAALACQTLMQKASSGGGPIIVEPLPHFRQLKDLVVDLEPFFESLKVAVPWLVMRDDYDGRMTPEVARRLEDPATCILCGICNAEAHETGAVKPATVVKALRLAQDPRDAVGVHRLRLL
jgi:succinate dehydrogenase / fumarate reductase, iron-sulfur subunit